MVEEDGGGVRFSGGSAVVGRGSLGEGYEERKGEKQWIVA